MCHVISGINVNGHYYFGDTRRHGRYSWEPRNLELELTAIAEVENEDRVSYRTNLAKLTGFTGLSSLHRLYPLYGFNFPKDLVFDAMHNIPLNIVSKQLHRLIDCKTFDSKELDMRLQAVQWPSGD